MSPPDATPGMKGTPPPGSGRLGWGIFITISHTFPVILFSQPHKVCRNRLRSKWRLEPVERADQRHDSVFQRPELLIQSITVLTLSISLWTASRTVCTTVLTAFHACVAADLIR